MSEEVQPQSDVQVEVCVDSLESALAAVEGGASRLEVCSELSVGGVTPSLGFLSVLRETFPNTPLVALLRPRSGDFVYSDVEFKLMEADIQSFISLGIHGVALGALTLDDKVDVKRLKNLVAKCKEGGLRVTFHRAFDLAADLDSALEDIIALNCDRILTSGGFPSLAEEKAIENLKRICNRASGRIQILPGGGVSEQTLPTILSVTGLREVHGSARVKIVGARQDAMSKAVAAHERWVCSADRVRALRLCVPQ